MWMNILFCRLIKASFFINVFFISSMMNLKSCIPNNSIFQTLLKVFILTKIMHLLSCLNLTIFFSGFRFWRRRCRGWNTGYRRKRGRRKCQWIWGGRFHCRRWRLVKCHYHLWARLPITDKRTDVWSRPSLEWPKLNCWA